MRRYYALFALIFAVMLLLCGGSAAVLSLYSPSLLWVPLGLLAVVLIGFVICIVRFRRIVTRWMNRLLTRLDPTKQETIESFPLPVLLLDSIGDIIGVNRRFRENICSGEEIHIGTPIYKVFDTISVSSLKRKNQMNVRYGALQLTVHVSVLSDRGEMRYALYFVDDTEFKEIAAEYEATRPVVMQICIDNLEEATEHLRVGDRARISGQIETILEDWLTGGGGILQNCGNNRFLAVTELRHLNRMTEDRFSVLDRVRNAFPEAGNSITLSIGVGEGDNSQVCRVMALQALDMALSRGGDQVAIKTINGYDFYGGKSRGVERRTKVRTRIVANALRDLMTDGDGVLIMGHRLSDLDCLGSGAALAMAARRLGIEAHVVARRNATMGRQLIDKYDALGLSDLFIEPEMAQKLITRETLLIVVDTHSQSMLDAPAIYDMVNRVVVIDHHRRMVNYIQDTVLTYHEPSSSSACELVSELLPYFSEDKPGRTEAEALMAGIMLDTRNFVLRTGVRTFEAAAYLRSLGADTVEVKKMFSESMELYRFKSDLVARAQVYHKTAISVTDEDFSTRRTAAAQAADDLLSVQGVVASFVVTKMGEEINISARSFGECNVQLIMESLGGGGHLTMAAVQLKNITAEEAEKKLKEAIDRYFSMSDR